MVIVLGPSIVIIVIVVVAGPYPVFRVVGFFLLLVFRRAPSIAEQVAVFGEEAHEQAAADVGPEDARLDGGAGVEGECLETEAG